MTPLFSLDYFKAERYRVENIVAKGEIAHYATIISKEVCTHKPVTSSVHN